MTIHDDNFANNMARARVSRGFEQKEFSEALAAQGVNLSPALIYRCEARLRKIPFGEAWAISKVLGIPMEVMAQAHAEDEFEWLEGEEPAPKFTRPKQIEVLAEQVLGEVRARVMELIVRGDN